MEVRKINSINTVNPLSKRRAYDTNPNVSFKAGIMGGGAGQNIGKRFWLVLRRLAEQMKDITEIKNAFIAAIGTGIIAPIIILLSPGKGDKQDKDKKFLQALRQPLSALLQVFFQVPATVMINKYIDSLGYEKKIELFKDDVIGDLIPTEKYLSDCVKKEEIAALDEVFNNPIKGRALRQELEAKIKADYKNVGLEVSNDTLKERMEKEKENFLRKKIANKKFEEFKEQKIQHILDNPDKYPKLQNIKEIDLVTEDYRELLAKHRRGGEFAKLEKDANLSFFDKALRMMGFETKKVKELNSKIKNLEKEIGLELLKEDYPEIFNDQSKKIRKYVETYQKEAEKIFTNKKFAISLFVNLFMVTISCFTLNWIHPRVNKWIENKKAEKNATNNTKVEVA